MRNCLRLLLIFFMPVIALAGDIRSDVAGSCAQQGDLSVSGEAPLTLQRALLVALDHHPELAVADCEIRSAEGQLLQAGLRPNPELGTEVENFSGSGRRGGFRSTETTLQVRQLIELGRKRAKRQQLASATRDLSAWDREAKRLNVITDTRKAFIDVIASQARLGLTEDLATLADAVLVAVNARVKAGKVPPIEASRATVALNRTQLTVLEAQGRLTVARQRLAIQWGDAHPSFPSAAGALDVLPARPELPDVLDQIKDHPALARWPDEMQRRRSELELASAEAVPNVVVSGGFRHFAENDDLGVVFGVSIPLPLFNRNQGAILSAQATMEAADAALEVARRSLLAEVHEQYQALITASAEDGSLRLNALPLATQVFEATQSGYREGKFSLLEVLDAQRALFETRSAQVEAEARYQIAIAELERLTAKSVEAIAEEKPSAAGDPP